MKRILLLFITLVSLAGIMQGANNVHIYSRWSGRVVMCSDSLNQYSAYQWFRDVTTAVGVTNPSNFSPIAGATGQYYAEEGGLTGYYYVKVTLKSGGTQLISDTLSIHTQVVTKVSIAPNPVSASSSVRIETTSPDVQMAKIQIYNMSGALLRQYTANYASESIEAPSVTGCYLVRIQLENGDLTTQKLFVK
jgi:hypothetical protein